MVLALSGFAPSAHAADQWARDKGVSDESGRAPQNSVVAMGSMQEEGRGAAFQRRILAPKLQRWYVGFCLKMREALVSALGQPGLSVGNRVQSPQACP